MNLFGLVLIGLTGGGAIVAHRQGNRRASVIAGAVCVALVVIAVVFLWDATGAIVQ